MRARAGSITKKTRGNSPHSSRHNQSSYKQNRDKHQRQRSTQKRPSFRRSNIGKITHSPDEMEAEFQRNYKQMSKMAKMTDRFRKENTQNYRKDIDPKDDVMQGLQKNGKEETCYEKWRSHFLILGVVLIILVIGTISYYFYRKHESKSISLLIPEDSDHTLQTRVFSLIFGIKNVLNENITNLKSELEYKHLKRMAFL